MFEDHGEYSQLAFTVGKAYLEPFLNYRHEILFSAMPAESALQLKLEGAFWDDIRAIIKLRKFQTQETPDQIRMHEINYLQALGYFDQEPDKIIDPVQYESKENQDYIRDARAAYVAKTLGKPNVPPSAPPI